MSNFRRNDDGKNFRKDRDGQKFGKFGEKSRFERRSERKDKDGRPFREKHEDRPREERKERPRHFEDKGRFDDKERHFDKPRFDKPRFEKNDKFDKEKRNDRPERRRSEKGISPKQADLLEVCDLDRGIIKLMAKRAKVIERMISFKSLDANTEKAIRTSWEANTAKYCPDPKISRELYLLIQSVKAVDETDYDHAYNLAPLPKPVAVDLQAPASSRLARFYMTLAAASGKATKMKNVPLTDSIIHTIKSLNAMGGDLWFENNGTILSRSAKGLQRGNDKIIHVGSDEQSLWLCLALSLGLPYHLKITGENQLCKLDFAPISQFLAKFSARLVQVIPASIGLPIRIEASGMLASEIEIPSNLPMDFVFALILAAPFWESPVCFDMKAYYAELQNNEEKLNAWNIELEDIKEIIATAKLPVQFTTDSISIEPQEIFLPEEIILPSDGEICISFFLLPAFTSGYVSLKGHWTKKGQQKYLEQILHFAGLDFSIENTIATAKGDSGKVNGNTIPPCSLETATLLTLWAWANGNQIEMSNAVKESPITESFFAHLGYGLDKEKIDPLYAPFMAPSAAWAVAYALGAYLRPRVKLVNPNILNDYYPFFWRMYNTLPNPSIDKAEKKDDGPKPRRIIAQGVYAEVPEPIDPYDD